MSHITPTVLLRHRQIEMSRGKISALNSSRSKSSLLVNPSTLFSLLVLLVFFGEIFLPLSLLAAFRFCYQGFLFYFFYNLFFFSSFSLQPTEWLVNTKLANSNRGQTSLESRIERERERSDQHLPNSLSTPPRIFPFL